MAQQSQISETSRAGNFCNALSVLISDRIEAASNKIIGRGTMVSAALIQIGEYPSESIDNLRQRLGLSHSAVVRLTDHLVESGLINKERGAKNDARIALLTLTAKGKKQRANILAERSKIMEKLLKALSSKEIKDLSAIIGKVLEAAVNSDLEAENVCRLCDTQVYAKALRAKPKGRK